MGRKLRGNGRGLWRLAVVLLVGLLAAPLASAQVTTATLRGKVVNQDGKTPIAGATVTLQSKVTGFAFTAVTGDDGSFVLAGLPPGPAAIAIEAESFERQSRDLVLQLGQSIALTFELSPTVVLVEDINVFGDVLTETRTSVVGTNVTPDQIRLLPQNNRNFLNFAILAPGVQVTQEEFRKELSVAGQPGASTNVFIDGASYKNDVLEGGVVGQDASRGNPFPQGAVQEFQVLTQNFKAEYERASTGLISAVTRSGGNELDGELLVLYQNKDMVGQDAIAEQRSEPDPPKPDYKRFQGSLAIGGPIIKDKLTWFLSAERNHQNRAGTVVLGTPADPAFDPAPFQKRFEGTFTSPFRSTLLFGKVSWQPGDNQAVDFSYNRRDETDERGFGGLNAGPITAFERGENVDITNDTFAVKHRLTRSSFLNEASLQVQNSNWNPRSITNAPQRNYFGFAEFGSRNGDQEFKQDRVSLRDDFTYFISQHALKGGVVLSKVKYDVTKQFGGNGSFNFTFETGVHDYNSPFEAFLGAGDPRYKSSNTQFGLYGQDDWAVTPKLMLNLGLRWDYETDMLDTGFRTPQEFSDALSDDLAANGNWNALSRSGRANYISNGSNRKPFKKAFQPRVGFSYDFEGDGKSVLFGGAGRYYDRDIFNVFFDEKFRLKYRFYRFCFYANAAEQSRCGTDGVAWNDNLLRPGELAALVASGQVQGKPEIFLIPNDLELPYNDQFSLGYRRRLGPVIASITGTYLRGKNGFTYIWGNRDFESGNTIDVSPQFSNLLLGTDDKEYWYKGLFLTFERPLSTDAKWGFTFTYTRSEAEQRGNDAFSLDYHSVQDYPRAPTPNDERHRIVATAIARLPWDLTFSANLQLGSGLPYFAFDARKGFDFNDKDTRNTWIRPDRETFILGKWAYRQVDLRLEKVFSLPKGQSLAVALEGFNVFDFDNQGCLETFIPPGGPSGNANFGRANCTIGPTSQTQIGVRYGF